MINSDNTSFRMGEGLLWWTHYAGCTNGPVLSGSPAVMSGLAIVTDNSMPMILWHDLPHTSLTTDFVTALLYRCTRWAGVMAQVPCWLHTVLISLVLVNLFPRSPSGCILVDCLLRWLRPHTEGLWVAEPRCTVSGNHGPKGAQALTTCSFAGDPTTTFTASGRHTVMVMGLSSIRLSSVTRGTSPLSINIYMQPPCKDSSIRVQCVNC
jgi:hypothetical protein